MTSKSNTAHGRKKQQQPTLNASYRAVKNMTVASLPYEPFDEPFGESLRARLRKMRMNYRKGATITYETLTDMEYYNSVYTHLVMYSGCKSFLSTIIKLKNSNGTLNTVHIPLRYFVGRRTKRYTASIRLQITLHILHMFKLMTSEGRRNRELIIVFLTHLQAEWDFINISDLNFLPPSYISGLVNNTVKIPSHLDKITQIVNDNVSAFAIVPAYTTN